MATNTVVTNYDPSEILINFFGVSIEGFLPGSFASIVKDVDMISTVSGVAGEGMFVKNNDPWSTVTLTLMMNSASNDFLSATVNADAKLFGAGLGVLQLKNNLGRELFTCPSARIVKVSDVSFSDTGSDAKTWIFKCYGAIISAGGH